MLRGLAGAIAVLLFSVSALHAQDDRVDPSKGVILSSANALRATQVCSRAAPVGVEGAWTPEASQIEILEKRLPAEIIRAAVKERWSDVRPSSYWRWYAGLVIGGHRVIYVNGSAFDPMADNKNRPSFRRVDWHLSPTIACDDGPSGFGVEYDPETEAFRNFEFDGCMCVREPALEEKK